MGGHVTQGSVVVQGRRRAQQAVGTRGRAGGGGGWWGEGQRPWARLRSAAGRGLGNDSIFKFKFIVKIDHIKFSSAKKEREKEKMKNGKEGGRERRKNKVFLLLGASINCPCSLTEGDASHPERNTAAITEQFMF